jgi:ADP-ribose pyrophosphatase YjhB (NUDIX family)
VLLVRRSKAPLRAYWCLPGGYIDYSEKPQEAAAREVMEETNLKIEVGQLVGVYQIDNDPRGINIDIVYTGHVIGGQLSVNAEEASAAKFYLPFSLPRRMAYKHADAIRDWLGTSSGNFGT